MSTMDHGAILFAARAAGFDDARIVPCRKGVCKEEDNSPFKTKSILVLFFKYSPTEKSPKGRIGLSGYYIAANAAYVKAGELAGRLCEMGIKARRDAGLPARGIALLCGGHIGKNGFYYHPKYGSLVHIQTMRLGVDAMDVPAGEAEAPLKKCMQCKACVLACPTGALTEAGLDVSKCMRRHMDGPVLDEVKPHVYQLLGCEKCQTACPMNRPALGKPPDFDLTRTILGETMGELRELAGKNMARRVRVTNQAMMVAANRDDPSVMDAVLALVDDPRFSDACRYYLKRMTVKKD